MDSDSVGVQGGWAMSDGDVVLSALVGALLVMGVVGVVHMDIMWLQCKDYQEVTGHDTKFRLPASCFVLRGDDWRLLGECGD